MHAFISMLTVKQSRRTRCSRGGYRNKTGRGLLNTLINKLPFELHLPGGYQYCGPGTRLQKRIARGDKGINPLDAACKVHDISYSRSSNLQERHKADKELEHRAWERVKSVDASKGEKAAAWLVTTAMKTKQRFGMGYKSNKKLKKAANTKLKKVAFRSSIVRDARKVLGKANKGRRGTLPDTVSRVLLAARASLKNHGGKKRIRVPRIIPIPKVGGFLPLIPLFAGLSALGALSGGAAGIVKAVNAVKEAKDQIKETSRHNKAMEAISVKKSGAGLFLKPYRSGLGLFLTNPKNF